MIHAGSKYQYLVKGVRKLKPGEAFGSVKGEQFDCEPTSFQNILYQVANTAGRGWRVTTTVIGNSVVWAFYKETDYMKPNLPAYPIVKKLKGE